MKPLTPLEAADRVDEGHAVASGLGLDEVAALLRSMAQCSSATEDMVEAGAKAAAEAAGFCWENCAQDQWRRDMRAGLDAALSLGIAQGSGDCGEMAAQIEELSRRVTAHEQLQARIVQALGRETWQGDLAVAVEAEVARANGNGKSCAEAFKMLDFIRNSAAETLRMPWLLDTSVSSTKGK